MLKLLIRLWPLHLLCLLVWVVASTAVWGSEGLRFWPLMGNAFMLHAWAHVEGMGGNTVSWCLSDLLFFYALFPVLMRWSARSLAVFTLGLMLLYYLLVPQL